MKRKGHSETIVGRRVLWIVTVCVLGLSSQVAVAQTTITVGQGGGYDHSTIQAGIDAATTGDTVVVYPGTYVENINFKGKNIILRSTDPTDTATVAATIIDGNSSGSAVTFSGTETSSCVLAGFTICNGKAIGGMSDTYGGGLQGNATHAVIEYNVIVGNLAFVTIGDEFPADYGSGGGLAGCDGPLRYNTIDGNVSAQGGGGLWRCDGVIHDNVIQGNEASGFHGGIGYIGTGGGLEDCRGTIQNNTITSNTASQDGGGLFWCNGTIQNNTIAGNTATRQGGGLYGCGGTIQNNTIAGNSAGWRGGGLDFCNGTIRNCIIWENVASSGAQLRSSSEPSYSCIQDWTGGGLGNISDDPQFVEPDNGDFHLLGTSPCIDAGTNTDAPPTDKDGLMRPYDGDGDGTAVCDMGAYEYGSVLLLPPAAPSNLTAQGFGSDAILLNWTDNSNNEAGFKIERKEDLGGPWVEIAQTGPNATTYVDSGISGFPCGMFYYRVCAFNAVGNSAYSNEAGIGAGSCSLDVRRWHLYR